MADTALSILFGWTVWGTVIAALVGVALGVLGMNPAQYTIAEVCFTVAAIMFGSRMAWWMVFELPQGTSATTTWAASFIVFGIAGTLYVQSIRWIERLRPEDVHATFSTSTLWTKATREMVTSEFSGAQKYLRKVGFDTPLPIPPVQINENSPRTTDGKSGIGILSNPQSNYGDSIIVSPYSATQKDQMRGAYFGWVFQRLFDIPKYTVSDHVNRWVSSTTLAVYYAGSYSGDFIGRPGWDRALWDIRERYKSDFTDKLLFYAFQNFSEERDIKKDFDVFFWNRLATAMNVLDSSAEHEVTKILDKNGIKWKEAPASPAATAVP